VPFFLLCLAVEGALSELRSRTKGERRKVFSRQTLNNLSAGAIQTMGCLFYMSLSLVPYRLIYDAARPLSQLWVPEDALGTWPWFVAMLLATDLAYYWAHRMCHACNIGWASHVPHHSSPDFNYSTALRQGTFERAFSTFFYLPLAALGVPIASMYYHRGVNSIMQFWVHTEMLPKLGPVEWFMNTPSHHRVHHARNYGRCNFGGMLIIWDRLFGTYVEEEERCVYGLDDRDRPLGTHDPLWHQVHHFWHTFALAARSGRVASALFTRMPGPGMIMPKAAGTDGVGKGPEEMEGPACDSAFSWVDVYVWVNYLFCAWGLMWVMEPDKRGLSFLQVCSATLWLTCSFVLFGYLMMDSHLAWVAEALRLAVAAVGASHVLQAEAAARVVGLAMAAQCVLVVFGTSSKALRARSKSTKVA